MPQKRIKFVLSPGTDPEWIKAMDRVDALQALGYDVDELEREVATVDGQQVAVGVIVLEL